MPKYRKKPVVIEAVQYTGGNDDQIIDFCGCAILSIRDAKGNFLIGTIEGPQTASIGDFIIKGVAGEFYPCKPDIFSATYEDA